MENLDIISKNFSEESVIKFVNGEEITGAKGVSNVILECCRVYNEEYITTKNQMIVKGFLIGAGITLTAVVGIGEIIRRHKKKTQK